MYVTPGRLALFGAGALAAGVGLHVLGDHLDNDLVTHAGDALAIGGGATLLASAAWGARNFLRDSSYRTVGDLPVGGTTVRDAYQHQIADFAVSRPAAESGSWALEPLNDRARELTGDSVVMRRLNGLLTVADQPGAAPARISNLTVSFGDAGDAVSNLGTIPGEELARSLPRSESREAVGALRAAMARETARGDVVLGWYRASETRLTLTSDSAAILADTTPVGRHTSEQLVRFLNAASTGAHELAHARSVEDAETAYRAVVEGAAEVSGEAHTLETAAAMQLPVNPNDLSLVAGANGYQGWTIRLRNLAALGGVDVHTPEGLATFDHLQSTLGPQELLRELLTRVGAQQGIAGAELAPLAANAGILENDGWTAFLHQFHLDDALGAIVDAWPQ